MAWLMENITGNAYPSFAGKSRLEGWPVKVLKIVSILSPDNFSRRIKSLSLKKLTLTIRIEKIFSLKNIQFKWSMELNKNCGLQQKKSNEFNQRPFNRQLIAGRESY